MIKPIELSQSYQEPKSVEQVKIQDKDEAAQQSEDEPAEENSFYKFNSTLLSYEATSRKRYSERLRTNMSAKNTMDVLAELGFRNNDGALSFVNRNVVYQVTKQDLQDALKEIFKDESDHDQTSFFSKSNSHLTSTGMLLLPKQDKPYLWDTANTSLFPFLNGVCKVWTHNIALIQYEDLDCVVNVNDILDFNLDLSVIQEGKIREYLADGQYYRFLRNINTEPRSSDTDENQFESLELAIGKTLHTYDNPVDPAMVILSEQTDIGQVNAGGTGKGLVLEGVMRMRPSFAKINGKSFRKEYGFNFEEIKSGCRVVIIDETDEYGSILEHLYSPLTGDMVLKRKHKDPLVIDSTKKPKFIMATNSPKAPTNDSDLRRSIHIPLKRYYNDKHRPIDDFGGLFWHDWSAEEWNKYYLTMINATLLYISHGYNKKVLPRCTAARDLIRRSQMNEIGVELYDFFLNKFKDSIIKKEEFEIVPIHFKSEYLASCTEEARLEDSDLDTKNLVERLAKLAEKFGYHLSKSLQKRIDGVPTRYRILLPNKPQVLAPEAPRNNLVETG